MIEALERRQLLAGDFNAGFALPYVLDFNRPKTGIVDRDGMGTGFTWVQPNRAGDEYQPRLIDEKVGAGILRLYTNGTADAGSNFEGDDTLANILTTRFAASSKPFWIHARLNGPIPQIDQDFEQGGIIFGPDQDNYVKLVAASNGGKQGLQLLDEEKYKTGFKHLLSTTKVYDIGSFNSIATLDLFMSCNPDTGQVVALYSVNDGPMTQLPATLTLRPDKAAAFFSNAGFAGVIAQNKNNAGGIDVTFDKFQIRRGSLVGTTPPVQSGKIVTSSRRFFNDVRGSSGQTIGVSVRNDGTGPLTIPAGGLSMSGTDAAMFSASTVQSLPVTIQPGQSTSLKLTFAATSATSLGIKTANLAIHSNDPNTPVKNVELRGLATSGTGGTNEPSLQRIMDLYQIPDNVGDSNPSDVFLDDPPVGPNDELSLQQLKKAGPGDVTIQVLAVFGVSSNPAVRLGYYEPGSPAKQTELFTINTSDAQSVNPSPVGTTSFDPGDTAFAIYSVWPGFKNSDGSIRQLYEEDLFNSFDAGDKRHIRFYPYKNPDGSVVPNTYVMAHEELDAAKDNQDIIAIISNVTSASAGPEIGTDNLDGPPAPDRLVFNRFKNGDPLHPDTTSHTQAKVRVRNSGSATLSISSATVTSGPFSVLSGGGAQNIAPGKFADILVQFNGGGTEGLRTGTLTINSNDADEPAEQIQLAGFFQHQPEGGFEPTLVTLTNGMYGFGTTIVGPGQSINTGGKAVAVGEEVMSGYWLRQNTQLPITVRQLHSFHTQDNPVVLKRFNQGSTSTTTIFTTEAADSQTLYPRLSGGSGPAFASFTVPAGQAFGWKIDNENSDDTKNVQEHPGGGWGHHVRFYPLRNAAGQLIADAYLMVMDYNGVNYDYNDNMFLITNIKPANGAVPASVGTSTQSLVTWPTTATAGSVSSTDTLDWKDLLDRLSSV